MDNPPPIADNDFALPGHAVVSLQGKDALAFAQAQTMNDVAALADGHWQWNGWLTPKGRVIALFALLRLDAEQVWLLLPDADPQAIADGLRRFVFRSKVKIEVRDDLQPTGSFTAPALSQGSRLGFIEEAVELDLGAGGAPRTVRLGPAKAPADDQMAVRWRESDLRHGLPRLDASQTEQWTPQQLSLDRLKAYSVKKGCYPGQEIVARTHFLGQAKRGLALLEGARESSPGIDVQAGGQSIGRIASVAGKLALAVLPLERNAGLPLTARGEALREILLLDGLAR